MADSHSPKTTAAGLRRHDLVDWDWSASGLGKLAVRRGIRPIGRIVTRDDLPHMSERDGPLGIQCLDDATWVISPYEMERRGREIRKIPRTMRSVQMPDDRTTPRSPFDGKPYYCNTCGCGFGEFNACEDVDCELETAEQAKDRIRDRAHAR